MHIKTLTFKIGLDFTLNRTWTNSLVPVKVLITPLRLYVILKFTYLLGLFLKGLF